MAPAIRFDLKFVGLAFAIGVAAVFVEPVLRNAAIALAIAVLVLAPMPRGTRALTFAVMIGIATGISAINLFVVGIFQTPVTNAFDWPQAKYSLITFIGTVTTVLSAPAIGRLFDFRGVRRFALGSCALLALALISLHWLEPPIWHLYILFAMMPLLGAGTSSMAFSRVVARWFEARRGQAFGAALAGIGIGGAALSALSQYLINRVGWRGAYSGLGLLLLCVTLPVLYFWLHDSPAEVGLGPDGAPLGARVGGVGEAGSPSASVPSGYSARETRRLARFWRMLLAFFVLAFCIGGVMIQLVPILRARGVTADQAAAMQGMLGLALIVGRAFAGFLMDRLFAPFVAAGIIFFPTVGTALLAAGASGFGLTVAAVSIGFAAGAELDVIAYLITRYFGTRGYAENYGWQYAAWTLGSGSAPFLTARSYDWLGTHTPVLWFYVGLFAASAVMVARLGRYPDLAARAQSPALVAAPVV
jgi:MFS family permease